MTRDERHLTIEELEGLIETQARSPQSRASSEPLVRARGHLVSCEACQRLLSMHKSREQFLRSLREVNVAARTMDCPPNATLLEFAAGLVHHGEADQLLIHVTQCAHCGPLFGRAVEAFRERLSPEEQSLWQSLRSTQPEWQSQLVRQLLAAGKEPTGSLEKKGDEITTIPPARSTQTRSVSRISWWQTVFKPARLLSTGVLATALAFAVWFVVQMNQPPDVNQLLANAYTEQRVMDLRIAGAKYAPVRQQRGVGHSALDQPQALLDATPLISRQLKAHPDDPKWLHAKGRADLLAFRYEPALQTLQRAFDLQPDSPDLLIDLAIAHFQRAESNTDRAVDYGIAIDYLGRALAGAPDDPVALFNRAITEDKLHLYDPAIRDWQHYLQIDSSGPWADEARRRLAEVKKKAQNKQSSLLTPLFSTGQVASLANSTQLRAELNGRVEQYLHAALIEWLPQAFSLTGESQNSHRARVALTSLADVLRNLHDDSWLSDLLADTRPLSLAPAVDALATAVRANDTGDYAKGRISSRAAGAYFRSTHNLAGELRAQLEEVYSSHLLYDGQRCSQLVRSVQPRLSRYRYAWLDAELTLESAACEGLVGNIGRARSDINLGTKLAHDHDFPSLYLRGLGFQADTAGLLGETQTDFSLASQALDLFWSTPVDIMKGYNLYTDLDTAADALRFPHLQVALWQQATALIDLHPDLLQRAMAHRWLANSAYLANMPSLATQEFAEASDLFAASPPSSATARGKVDADVWLATLQVRQGDLQNASATLQQVQNALARAPGFAAEIGFYSAKTELALRRNDSDAAESSLRAAVYLAEWSLRSFSSETARRQWVTQTDRAYRDLVTWQLRRNDPIAALEFWEWYRGAEYRANRTEPGVPAHSLDLAVPPDPREAPALRAPGVVTHRLPLLREQTVITYAVFPTGTAVWVYDDRGIFSEWIATSLEDLQKQAFRFEHLCSARDSDLSTLRASARALYDLLITPIQNRLEPGRTLVFELDDVLSAVPMDALVDPEGRYLAQSATVVVAPSVYQTQRLHAAQPISPQTAALVVSVPASLDAELPPLSDADSEAQAVANSFHATRWLKGPLATVASIRHELAHALVFHFSGHAVSSPEITGLLLAERDDRTQRSRVLNAQTLDANAVRNLQLAVLAACDTAKGMQPQTSASDSVAQALLRYGVPHVVASRWGVDSNQTAILMRSFYEHLTAGDSVPASLHFAQLALLSQPASAHPYYWAAFAVQGI